MKYEKLIIFTDGGAQNNPGPAGIGIVFCDEFGNVIKKIKKFIGYSTNNIAEYRAILEGLKVAREKYQAKQIKFYLDSQLVASQLSGKYKIKNGNLKPLHYEIKSKMLEFGYVSFNYIPREKNKEADKLAKQAIKERKI